MSLLDIYLNLSFFVILEKLIIKSENFDSVSTNLYRYLGLINTALRNYEKANKYYDKSILSYKNNKDQTYSHFISLLNDKALNLVEMGNYQDGKKLLYQIISDSKNKQNIDGFSRYLLSFKEYNYIPNRKLIFTLFVDLLKIFKQLC